MPASVTRFYYSQVLTVVMVTPSDRGTALLGPSMGGPQCRMSILRNGNVACLCHLFSSMPHVDFRDWSLITGRAGGGGHVKF